jgi:DNA-binding winged helix-turn-helix (wHTH) protein
LTPTGGGVPVRLEPKLMDLLLLFAASGGRVLAKDEIVAAVWQGRAIGDDTLAAAISRLRAALHGASGASYLETIPKRGYRLSLDEGAGLRTTEAATPVPAETQALAAQGQAALGAPNPLSLPQARLYFEAAVKAAPGWAPAHAGLAETLAAAHWAGPKPDILAAARAAASAAVGLDEGHAGGWAALGVVILFQDRDFAAADDALRRAVALDPALASARRHRSMALLSIGRFVEAEREIRKAVELEPVSLAARATLLQVLIAARRYGPAIAEATRALELSPAASEPWYARGWARVLSGNLDEGVDDLLTGVKRWGVGQTLLADLRASFEGDGLPGLSARTADLFETQRVLFKPRVTDIAMLRAQAGQADAAFAALDIAAARDDPFLTMLPWLPQLDPLRADPRLERLMARVRLVR